MQATEKISNVLTSWSTRWVPDAFVIAIILTFLSGGLVWSVTDASLLNLIQYWGDGFWVLLNFAMQICLIMLTGYIIGISPLVKRMLNKIVNLARSASSAVAITALVSMVLCWVNWGIGLITSAIIVRFMAVATAQRGIKVDYRLLVACAYLGMAATWHAGLSGSAPLLVATPDSFLADQIGTIAASETIFHPFNLLLVSIVTVVLAALAWKLHPREENVVHMNPDFIESLGEPKPQSEKERNSPAGRIENSWILSAAICLCGLIWLIQYFVQKGFNPTLNTINFILLMLAIFLHRTPRRFLHAAEQGSRHVWYVIVQYPLYAGIFGMIKYSGFDQVVAGWIVSVATPETFPLLTCWYAGFLNYVVPSGGGQWAIQAPYTLEAARNLGVDPGLTVLSFAWGEMITDGIQPFFSLPLLAIAGVNFRDIMGFLLIFFIVYAAIVSSAFAIVPYLGWF